MRRPFPGTRLLLTTLVAVLLGGCGSGDQYLDVNPEWSGNGRLIAFDRLRGPLDGDLYAMRPDGSGVRVLAREVFTWSWSPNRDRIVMDVFGDDADIRLFTIHGGAVTPLTSNTVDASYPAWSPDGRRLALVRGTDAESSTLVVMDLETRALRAIAPPGLDPAWPVWSPDGRHVAFVGDFPPRLFVVAADGSAFRGEIERTRSFEAIDIPVWSPSGHMVLFNAGPFGLRGPFDFGLSDGHELYSLRVDDGTLKRLTRNDVSDRLEGISPNGACLLVETGPVADPGRKGAYVLRADGTERRRLPERAVESLDEAWAPDGRRVAVVRHESTGSRIVVMDGRKRYRWQLTDDSC